MGARRAQGHILCDALNRFYQLSLLHVPYKGEGPLVQDLVGGQIQIGAGSLGAMRPHLRSGALKAIGVVGTERSRAMPEVMTLLAQGASDPAFATVGWVGLVGPAGMPHDAVERWATIVREFLELPDVRQRFDTYGSEPKFVPTEAFFRTWPSSRKRDSAGVRRSDAQSHPRGFDRGSRAFWINIWIPVITGMTKRRKPGAAARPPLVFG